MALQSFHTSLLFFQYGSALCHFCGGHNSGKLEPHVLNKQAMWLVFNDFTSNYSSLLNKLDFVSSRDMGIQDMFTLVYKCLVNIAPSYLTSLFHVRISH